MSPTQRTSIELYRDLLRLIAHVAPGASPKSIALRTMIRTEFKNSQGLSPTNPSDQAKIEAMKGNAVRALSNYMLYEGGVHDRSRGGKLGVAMDKFHDKNVQGMQNDRDSGHRPGQEGEGKGSPTSSS
mmetsp:Transcript_3742/g.9542  ORF Transcript_3742/g.9542 Transcript_3742/m.9542 type:complete len:128 (-) Transcript_3742:460-843(-)